MLKISIIVAIFFASLSYYYNLDIVTSILLLAEVPIMYAIWYYLIYKRNNERLHRTVCQALALGGIYAISRVENKPCDFYLYIFDIRRSWTGAAIAKYGVQVGDLYTGKIEVHEGYLYNLHRLIDDSYISFVYLLPGGKSIISKPFWFKEL